MGNDTKPLAQLVSYALRLLSRREQSAYQLRERIQHQACRLDATITDTEGVDLADAVLSICQRNGWQSDDRFARALYHQYIRAGKSINAVLHVLKANRISNDTIASLYKNHNPEIEIATAYALATRRVQANNTPTQIAKALHFLQRRGFSKSTIEQVARKFGHSIIE